MKGLKTRHLVIANVPVGIVKRMVLHSSGDLDSKRLREISRRVEETPVKKLKVGYRVSWLGLV